MNKLPGGMFAGALGIAGDCTMLSGLDGMLFPFIASHSLEERRDPVNVVLVAPVDTSNGLRDATRIGDTRSVAFFGAAPHGGASRHVVSAVARAVPAEVDVSAATCTKKPAKTPRTLRPTTIYIRTTASSAPCSSRASAQ